MIQKSVMKDLKLDQNLWGHKSIFWGIKNWKHLKPELLPFWRWGQNTKEILDKKRHFWRIVCYTGVGTEVFNGNKQGNQETSVYVGFLCTELIWILLTSYTSPGHTLENPSRPTNKQSITRVFDWWKVLMKYLINKRNCLDIWVSTISWEVCLCAG